MIIVDTSVWIDLLRGAETSATAFLRDNLGHRAMGVGDLILLELLQGCRGEQQAKTLETRLAAFPCYRFGGQKLAILAAHNYRRLRALGITVRKVVDVLIASYCIERGFELLHNDRDFIPFEKHLGLRPAR